MLSNPDLLLNYLQIMETQVATIKRQEQELKKYKNLNEGNKRKARIYKSSATEWKDRYDNLLNSQNNVVVLKTNGMSLGDALQVYQDMDKINKP